MIKAVILDMDVVVVDNRDIRVEAFEILAERYMEFHSRRL